MQEYDHIVLVSLDTLRADCIGASPTRLWPAKYDVAMSPQTPLLDDIARSGAAFFNCISAAPYTSASHATYFTGQWPLRHGLYEFFNRRIESPTVFSFAKARGYHTMSNVDFPIILGKYLGFDRDVDETLIEDDDGFLDRLASAERSLSFAHFGSIHVPYGFHRLSFAGDDYRSKVSELEAELNAEFELPRDQLVETYRDQEDLELLYRYKRVVQYHYSRGNYSRIFELYLQGITYFMKGRFDRFFSRLMDVLNGRRYLVVLFGDHGEEYDAESMGHFNTLAEGVLRVPVIFFGPDVRPGIYMKRIRSVDVAPTIMTAVSGFDAASESFDGASLESTVWNGDDYPERVAYSQVYASDTAEFVAYQKRMLATGETPPLDHVRYKEAVYRDDYRFLRQTHHYVSTGDSWELKRCPTKLQLERIGSDYQIARVEDGARQAAMLSMLDDYNSLMRSGGSKAERTAGIMEQLRNMGYRA